MWTSGRRYPTITGGQSPVCIAFKCVGHPHSTVLLSPTQMECFSCQVFCSQDMFSSAEWRMGEGQARCEDCTDGGSHYSDDSHYSDECHYDNGPVNRNDHRSLWCADCGADCLHSSSFSATQFKKGPGRARCQRCVNGGHGVPCTECGQEFRDQDTLWMHMKLHQARNVTCPSCGETRFSSVTGVLQHVESGTCPNCRGQENAARQIYDFVRSREETRPFLSGVPMLEYDHARGGVPPRAYECPQCHRQFRFLSQLTEHQCDTHFRRSAGHLTDGGRFHRPKLALKFTPY